MISRTKKIAYVLAFLLTVLYLIWRVLFTLPWNASIGILIFAILLIGSEIISNITAYIVIYLRIRVAKKHIEQDLDHMEYLPGVEVPDVDIIVATHDEDPELLRKTFNAISYMEYPDKRKVHLIVADDGNRPEVATLTAEYGGRYIGLSGNKHAKSGNINHALTLVNSPLVAIFDADMIPYSTFLNATVPVFMQNMADQAQDDPKEQPLGFVQTPQSFYNADIFQFNLFSEKVVPNEQDYFSRDINVLNSMTGSAIFTGSNTVFLRQAIDDAGGFPVGTLTEDFELGGRINMERYVSYSTKEPQASGISPVDVKGVIKQRVRWAHGVIQSSRNMRIFWNRKLKFNNRLVLINSYLYWWSFSRRIIFMAAPVIFALFEEPVVIANLWLLMIFWAPGYFLLHWVLGDTSSSIRNERWGEVQETFFAPYLVLPVLFQALGIKQTKFKVTDKDSVFGWRDRLYMAPYVVAFAFLVAAIIHFNYGKFGTEIMMGSIVTFWLVMHLINVTFCIFLASGRPVYRDAERFDRTYYGNVMVNGVKHAIETINVSEKGMLVITPNTNDVVTTAGQEIEIELKYKNEFAHVLGHIVRVIDVDGQHQYAIELVEGSMGRHSSNVYFQIIYDGFNLVLPEEQDEWITPTDALYTNVAERFEKWMRRYNKWAKSDKKRGRS